MPDNILTKLSALLTSARAGSIQLPEEAMHTLAECYAAIEARDKELTAATAEIVRLTAENGNIHALASRKAASINASLGVPAVPRGVDTEAADTKDKVVERFNELVVTDPKAASDYWRKHQSTLNN